MAGWESADVGWESDLFGWESDTGDVIGGTPVVVTIPWQFELNGLTIGTGTPWEWSDTAPDLFGYAAPRHSDVAIPGAWGEVSVGPDLAVGRDITFKVQTNASTNEEALLYYFAFVDAWKVADVDAELYVQTPLGRFLLKGRPRKVAANLDDARGGVIEIAAQFRALDPRFYDDDESSSSANLISLSGGMAFPVHFPIAFGFASPGVATLVNGGNVNTGLVAQVFAAPGDTVHSPDFHLASTGERVAFTGLDVPEGLTLIVDWRARTALLARSDDPSQSIDVTNYVDRTVSDWWTGTNDLPPGAQTVTFGGTGGAGSVLFTFRSAWLF